MFYLMPQFSSIRFVTSMPTEITQMTAKIQRTSGANRHIWIDEPIVEIDVWGDSSNTMAVSIAAREIQAAMLSLAGHVVQNGVIQHVETIAGPRRLAEVNPDISRYNSTYLVRLHP